MDVSTLKRIKADPNYQKLVAERKSFGWTLTIITLVSITALSPWSLSPPASSRPRSRATSRSGSFWASLIILGSILITGIYVLRANSRYDDLTSAIVNAATSGEESDEKAIMRSGAIAGR